MKYLPYLIIVSFSLACRNPETATSTKALPQNTAMAEKADERFLAYTVNPKESEIQLYWKDDKGNIMGNFRNLKTFVEGQGKQLLFAMNAGMYKTDASPLGLFIQSQKTLAALNTASGEGNFYLKPNGVFYITTDNTASVCQTSDFVNDGKVKYATQSGPMLVIDGKMHSAFKQGSPNVNIRNGVGILPDGKVVFVLSKKEINFYDFAEYFQNLGCGNALYLDGFVSRAYLPEQKWVQTDGNFGVMVGVVK